MLHSDMRQEGSVGVSQQGCKNSNMSVLHVWQRESGMEQERVLCLGRAADDVSMKLGINHLSDTADVIYKQRDAHD